MTNADLKNKFDQLLRPLGFKKKGTVWTKKTIELEKIVALEMSNFRNAYYVSYGFNIKDLDYDAVTMHVFRGLGSEDVHLNAAMQETFDLQSPLDFLVRSRRISEFMEKIVLPEIKGIDTKSDLVSYLMTWKHLSTVPLRVKEHLNMNAQ